MKTLRLIPLLLAAATLPPQARETSPAPDGTPPGTRFHQDIPYVENGHPRQKLDLYLPPPDERRKRPLPLVIWIHGGAFWAGDKGDHSRARALPLIEEGFAVASINYRLSQHAIFPEPVKDCKAAVRWLRAHAAEFGLDPDRFAAWGESAGAYMSVMLAVTGGVETFGDTPEEKISSRIRCAVDFYGPSDFTVMDEQAGQLPGSDTNHDAPDSPESKLLGGPVQENLDKARAANPITYATGDDAPLLILHGDKDLLVPHGQSVILAAALKKAGAPVTFRIVKNAGHGDGFGEEEQRDALKFLKKHLSPEK